MRNYALDILRVLGLLLVILAHVDPPQWLWQMRTFDVILLVGVSTISYTEFARPMKYFDYIKKRLKRFVKPVWTFLAFLVAIFFVLQIVTGNPTPFNIKTLLIAMFTFSGLGYLWIVRVYIYNAVINPIILRYLRGG